MSKILVSFFSASGTTKKVAERVADVLKGDLFEIEPKEKYTKADLNWLNPRSRTTIEMKKNVKPEIAKKVSNLKDYGKVIIGFPVWWYKEPTIIDQFLDENDMTGKEIYVFVTSGSSPIDSTYKSLKANYPDLNFVNGQRFKSNVKDEEINGFINN